MLYHNWIISWKEISNFKITLRNSERVCNASMNMYYSSSETIKRIKTMINQLIVSTGLIMNITYAKYLRERWLYFSGLVQKIILTSKTDFLPIRAIYSLAMHSNSLNDELIQILEPSVDESSLKWRSSYHLYPSLQYASYLLQSHRNESPTYRKPWTSMLLLFKTRNTELE